MATDPDERDSIGRELVRGLLRGASAEDLAWASGCDADEVMSLVREAVTGPQAEAPPELGPDDRRRIADYLLLAQSPGQAAGTWELLESSPAALDWTDGLRSRLDDLYPAEPPPLPSADKRLPVPARERRPADPVGNVGQRREERRRERDLAEAQGAAAIALSPFRDKAVREHGERQERIKLPHYASRPVRLALYGLLATFAVGLALCAFVSVPIYTTAKVLVVDLDDGAPGGERGLTMVALFPADARRSLKKGRSLAVQLPDTDERVRSKLRFVEDETLAARQIVERYSLPESQANRVLRPYAVALAPLRTPDGGPSRASFKGAVATEAEVQTGSERVIGLPF